MERSRFTDASEHDEPSGRPAYNYAYSRHIGRSLAEGLSRTQLMLLLPYWRIADYICGACRVWRGMNEGANCGREMREVEVEPIYM